MVKEAVTSFGLVRTGVTLTVADSVSAPLIVSLSCHGHERSVSTVDGSEQFDCLSLTRIFNGVMSS